MQQFARQRIALRETSERLEQGIEHTPDRDSIARLALIRGAQRDPAQAVSLLDKAARRGWFPNGREIRDRRDEEGGLGVLGPVQDLGGAVPRESRDRLIERGIGGGKDGGGRRRRGDERLPHADRLRALAGEDEGRGGHRDRA